MNAKNTMALKKKYAIFVRAPYEDMTCEINNTTTEDLPQIPPFLTNLIDAYFYSTSW